jgi:radical SAM protein with 4Fe4S-binding SPASM domain
MTTLSRIREPRDLARILLGRPTRAEQDELARVREVKRLAQEQEKAEARARRDQLLGELRYWKALAVKPVYAEPIFAIDNIELTNRCPMRCIMCPRTEHMTRAQGYMSFEVFKRVIDEFVAVNPEAARTKGAFLHHFGESLLHPEVGRFIRYAEESGVRVKLSINPLAMKDRVIDALIQSAPSYLMIALDGHDDASFERIRGVPDAYDFSVERLHVYLARKVAAKVPTFVELGMIDFVENENSLHLLRDRWAGVEGIDNVTAKRFITWDGSAEEINAYAPQPMTNEEARKHFPVPSCHLPWETVSVTWDGSVVPCCYDYDRKMVLGNVMQQTLTEIWNGPSMRALRTEFRSNAVENPLCRQCPKLYRTSKRMESSEAEDGIAAAALRKAEVCRTEAA